MKKCQFRIDNVFEMRHIKSGYYVNKNERVLKINILTYLISNINLISQASGLDSIIAPIFLSNDLETTSANAV